jgi:MerR family transcriptional regulator, heat shock protein HspR
LARVAGEDEPCYLISIAASMLSIHPQTLRRYEELGLVRPARMSGKRLYSDNDIERLRKIARLTDELGVNLAGVEVILSLTERLESMQSEMGRMRKEMEKEIDRLQGLIDKPM